MTSHPAGLIQVALAPAPVWAGAVLVVHGLAVACAWLALPVAPAALVTAGLAATAWVGASSALVRGPWAVRALELRPDGSAAYLDAHGEWKTAVVAGAACLGHRFAALRLRAGAERRGVILVPGAVDEASFRRARVWARWRLPARPGLE